MPIERLVDVTDVIFIGKVLDDGFDGRSTGRPAHDATFTVEEVFKGLPRNLKSIRVDPSKETDCFTHYTKGKRYLMFTRRIDDQTVLGGNCSGSDLVKASTSEIKFLRSWRRREWGDR